MSIQLFVLLSFSIALSFVFANKNQVIRPDDNDIERPCQFEDHKCIRKEFLFRGWCLKIFQKSSLQVLKIGEITDIEIPYFNYTGVQENLVISGLEGGKVVEFYINKKTDTAVFSISFTDVEITSRSIFSYHRQNKESIDIVMASTKEHYPSLTTTTITSGLRFISSQKTWAYVHVLPEYSFGDLDSVHDPEVLHLFESVGQHEDVAIRELFMSRAELFATSYVQNVICDMVQGVKDYVKILKY